MRMPPLISNFNPIKAFNPDWITDKIDKDGIDYLENLGFYLCDKKQADDRYPGYAAVTVSQIRNIFGEIKRITSSVNNAIQKEQQQAQATQQETVPQKAPDWMPDFQMLRPKIAYNAARVLTKQRNSRIKAFKEVLEKAHALVTTPAHLTNFTKFVEGIVAYHKVYGGKE